MHDHGSHNYKAKDYFHVTSRGYLVGFVLAAILTAIPFYLVMTHKLAASLESYSLIAVFASCQILVHMIYFLHLNTNSEGGWTILSLIFTLLIISVVVIGSVWVMYHLNTNMMPAMQHHNMHMVSPREELIP